MQKVIANAKYGRLLAIETTGKDKWGNMRWKCLCECGNIKVISGRSLRSGNTQSCGCYQKQQASKRGPAHPNWKGGRYLRPDGYVILNREGTSIMEHVAVMSEHLGRPLYEGETVHHRNGVRNDNKIKNLELRASSHGKGQTIPDLITFARVTLLRYAPSMLR